MNHAANEPELYIDRARAALSHDRCGIFVRARYSTGGFGTADLTELTTVSALRWLRAAGDGANQRAERTCLLLLGHSHDSIEAAYAALAEVEIQS